MIFVFLQMCVAADSAGGNDDIRHPHVRPSDVPRRPPRPGEHRDGS